MAGRFTVVLGFDMETDIGSFTDYYNGIQKGTPRLLELLSKHRAPSTFFWTGHAAENNANIVAIAATLPPLPFCCSLILFRLLFVVYKQ